MFRNKSKVDTKESYFFSASTDRGSDNGDHAEPTSTGGHAEKAAPTKGVIYKPGAYLKIQDLMKDKGWGVSELSCDFRELRLEKKIDNTDIKVLRNSLNSDLAADKRQEALDLLPIESLFDLSKDTLSKLQQEYCREVWRKKITNLLMPKSEATLVNFLLSGDVPIKYFIINNEWFFDLWQDKFNSLRPHKTSIPSQFMKPSIMTYAEFTCGYILYQNNHFDIAFKEFNSFHAIEYLLQSTFPTFFNHDVEMQLTELTINTIRKFCDMYLTTSSMNSLMQHGGVGATLIASFLGKFKPMLIEEMPKEHKLFHISNLYACALKALSKSEAACSGRIISAEEYNASCYSPKIGQVEFDEARERSAPAPEFTSFANAL